MEKITNKIVQKLIINNIIVLEEKELYEYCLLLLARKLFFIIILFANSLLLHCFLQTLFFYLAFSTSRYICGGYHANSSKGCFLISYSIIILYFIAANLRIIDYTKFNIYMMFISILILIIINPVESNNKPFSSNQKKYLPILSRTFIIVLTIISIILFKHISSLYYFSIWYGVFSNAILVVVAKNKERRIKNEKVY